MEPLKNSMYFAVYIDWEPWFASTPRIFDETSADLDAVVKTPAAKAEEVAEDAVIKEYTKGKPPTEEEKLLAEK